MIRRFIIFLVRMRLGLKKYELFRFENQKSRDIYYFTGSKLKKFQMSVSKYDVLKFSGEEQLVDSNVGLNWLLSLNPKVMINKIDDSDLLDYEYFYIKRWLKKTEWIHNYKSR